MFYNLKISSNNSEFSLESEDKYIVAREMDLYFSYFLDASNEFVSKIKKTSGITNPNLKSIELVEDNSADIKNNLPEIQIEIDDEQARKIEQNIFDKITEVEIEKNIDYEFSSQVPCVEQNNEELKFKEEHVVENELKFEIKEEKFNNKNDEMLVFKNDSDEISITDLKPEVKNEKKSSDKAEVSSVEDLIAQVANKLDTVNIQNSELKDDISEILDDKVNIGQMLNYNPDDNEVRFIDDDKISLTKNTENEIIMDNISDSSEDCQNKIDDIFETPKNIAELAPNPPVEVPSQAIDKINTEPEPTFEQKVQMMVEEFEKQEPTLVIKEDAYQIPPQEGIIEKREIVLDEKVETKETSQPQESKQEIKEHDFSDFIKNFKCEKTLDEFLICSYYIKNIANIESFTMKAINAKLFRASGKIAGMSVLNELIGLSYIQIVDDGDIKKYSITQKGEDYFIEKFQG